MHPRTFAAGENCENRGWKTAATSFLALN